VRRVWAVLFLGQARVGIKSRDQKFEKQIPGPCASHHEHHSGSAVYPIEAYYYQILVDGITTDRGSAHGVRVYGVVLTAPSGYRGIACYKILYLYIYTNEVHLQILQITEALFGITVKKTHSCLRIEYSLK